MTPPGTPAGTPTGVGILGGTGPQGRGLALRLARAGVPVVLGSPDPARAAQAAADLASGLPITGSTNAAAAVAGEVVLVTVPWAAHESTLRGLASDLADRIVVDIVNPLEFDQLGPRGLHVAEGSAAEQAQALLPGSRVVSGFHHVSAKLLLDESSTVDSDILICGDDAEAKRRVLALADLIPGARAIDAGPLRLSALLEGMTAVLLGINRHYRANTGVRLTGLDRSDARA